MGGWVGLCGLFFFLFFFNRPPPTSHLPKTHLPKPAQGTPDGDGFYLHYATKIAFALATLARATRNPAAATAAVDVLAAVATASLDDAAPGAPTFFHWKVPPSIDAPKPTGPPRVGGLDAFDVAVTARVVAAAVAEVGGGDGVFASTSPSIPPALARVTAAADAMAAARLASPRPLVAGDALDAGCAAVLATWASTFKLPFADRLAADADAALSALWRAGAFAGAPSTRLAFREMGATLGVQVAAGAKENLWLPRVAAIHSFWASAGRLTARDVDISPLMFACSAVPGAWRPDWRPEDGEG